MVDFIAAPSTDVGALAELGRLLGDDAAITTSADDRLAATKDFSWVSPLISERIPRTLPDAVVRPTTREAVRVLARWAFREGVPLTPRGRGTSNYGPVSYTHLTLPTIYSV